MPHFVSDNILDEGLNYLKTNCDFMVLLSAEPASFADADPATGTYTLADVAMTSGDFTLANGDTDGRKITCAAKSAVDVDTAGSGTYVAYVDDGSSELLHYFPLPSTISGLTTSDTVNFAAHDLTIRDTVQETDGVTTHFTNDEGFDNGLDQIDQDVDTIALLNGAPANLTEANTLITSAGKALATHSYSDVAAAAAGDTSGRKLTFNAVSGLAVEANGTATHVAYLAAQSGYVAHWFPLTTSRALTTANTFDVPAHDLEYRDAEAA